MNFIRQEKGNCLVLKKYKDIDKNVQYHSFANLLINLGGHEIKMYRSALPKEIDRIISADVDRCVIHDKSKAQIRYILSQLYHSSNEYNQGLSYVATFLSCFVHKDVVVNVMHDVLIEKMHRNVWKASLIHLHEEIHVLEQIVGNDVLEGMKKSDMYFQFFLQKYIFTMFINVFETNFLIEYLKNFLMRTNYHYFVIKSIMRQIYAENRYDDETMETIYKMLDIMSNIPEDKQKRGLEDADNEDGKISTKHIKDWLDEGHLIAETKIVVINDDGDTEDEISLYSGDTSDDDKER